jgi:hypothetical protein
MRASHIRRITEWGSPTELIESGYGLISYDRWCERELERINRGGRIKVKIVTRKDGCVALSR